MAGFHSRLSPSGASIWANCPGSVEAQAGEPDNSGEPAAQGTAAHDIFESCLTFGLEPSNFIGQRRRVVEKDKHGKIRAEFVIDIDAEMADHLQPCVDRVRDLGGVQFYEKRVSTERWLGEDESGTMDVGVIQKRHLIVGDLKYGFIPISPVDNIQLKLYALGFWDSIVRFRDDYERPKTVTLIIYQPRSPAGGGEWSMPFDDLLDFGDWIVKRADAAMKRGAPRTAGATQCQWCRANTNCETFDKFRLDLFGAKFDDLDSEDAPNMPDARSITPERRSYLIKHGPLISKWFTDLYAEALQDALAGRPTPGLKAVLGKRPRRTWASESRSEQFLRERGLVDEEIFVTKIVSPAVAEKALGKGGKAAIKDLTSQGDAAPVLVPEEDNREAVKSIAERFDDVSVGEDAD